MFKKIEIRNFKNLSNISFDLTDFSVVVGHNGSGKSNLLKAINLTTLLVSGKQVDSILLNSGLGGTLFELFFDRENPEISFTYNLELDGMPYTYSFTLRLELPKKARSIQSINNYFKVVNESLKQSNKELIIRSIDKTSIYNDTDNKLHPIEMTDTQLAISVLKGSVEIEKIRNWLSLVKVETFENPRDEYDNFILEDSEQSNETLAERIRSLRKSDNEKYNEVVNNFKRLIPEFANIQIDETLSKFIRVQILENSLKQPLSISSSSSGNLKTMHIILSLLTSPTPTALFIDELENSLHPLRIKQVVDFIKLIAEADNNPIQIVIATHNPILLDNVKPEEIIYVYKIQGKSVFKNPIKNSVVRDQLNQSMSRGENMADLYSTGLLEKIFSKGN